MTDEQALIPQAVSDLTGISVLALAAHPDDEVLGCGGALALHVQRGDSVRVLVVTGGEKGDFRGQYGEGYRDLREEEERQALAVLGIREVDFWRFHDRELHRAGDLVGGLREALERHRPGLVYAPSPGEIHPDHRALAHALWEAISVVGFAGKVAFYEVSAPLRPNTLVDITPVVEQKKAAIQCYRSQLEENDYLNKILGLNRFRSYTLPSQVQYAEAFWALSPSAVHPASLNQLMTEQARIPSEVKDQPLVSIIVRTKDRPGLLDEALTSIQQQTYRNIEVVVVNDGGVDVEEVIRKFEPFFKVQYIAYPENRGRAAAANTGLRAATGEYIGFLDDDDAFYPEHVETLVSLLDQSDYKVAYSAVDFVERTFDSDSLTFTDNKTSVFARGFSYEDLVIENYIPLMSLLFESDFLKNLMFDEAFELFEDWDMLIRAGGQTKFYFINKITAIYHLWGDLQIAFKSSPEVIELATMQIFKKHRDKPPAEFEAFKKMREMSLLRRSLSWQESQTERWWRKAQELEHEVVTLKHSLSWQESQTEQWRKAQELLSENARLSEIERIVNSSRLGQFQRLNRIIDGVLPIGSRRRLWIKNILWRRTDEKT